MENNEDEEEEEEEVSLLKKKGCKKIWKLIEDEKFVEEIWKVRRFEEERWKCFLERICVSEFDDLLSELVKVFIFVFEVDLDIKELLV